MLLINRLFVSLVSFSLLTIYSAATLSFIRYGSWPKNYHPESWSSFPINTEWWRFIDFFSLPVILYPTPIITSLIVTITSLYEAKKSKDLWLSCTFLAITIFIAIEPFKTLDWYFD